MEKEEEVFNNIGIHDLPDGIYTKEKTKPKPIRWPKDLYSNLAKICQKIKEKTNKNVSITRLVIFVMTKWVDKNSHIINKDKKDAKNMGY